MKKIATSILLACANVTLIGLGYLDDWLHFFRHPPAVISILPLVIAFVVIPFLVLFTIVFAIRDLFRRSMRLQAVTGLLLAAPIFYIYFIRRW